MTQARRVAREEMGLEQLHLALRGGTGLERFYRPAGLAGGRQLARGAAYRARRRPRRDPYGPHPAVMPWPAPSSATNCCGRLRAANPAAGFNRLTQTSGPTDHAFRFPVGAIQSYVDRLPDPTGGRGHEIAGNK